MVNTPRFVEAIQAKIGTAVDTEDMEKQIAVLQGQLKQAFGTSSGGHNIGKALSERLGIPFYDKELISLGINLPLILQFGL